MWLRPLAGGGGLHRLECWALSAAQVQVQAAERKVLSYHHPSHLSPPTSARGGHPLIMRSPVGLGLSLRNLGRKATRGGGGLGLQEVSVEMMQKG